jgi:hypothetical protein
MHKLTAALTVSALAFSTGTAVADEPSSTDQQNAAKLCKQLRTSSGSSSNFVSAVKALVGTSKKVTAKNAYGKCVSFHSQDEQQEREEAQSQAVKDCKAEREAAVTDEQKDAFAAKYGAKNQNSAYGKCVSSKARAQKDEADQDDEATLNAAKQCKKERAAGKEAFAKKYRTFGKCVSAIAKAKQQETTQS